MLTYDQARDLILPLLYQLERDADCIKANIVLFDEIFKKIFDLDYRWQPIETAPKDGTPFLGLMNAQNWWGFFMIAYDLEDRHWNCLDAVVKDRDGGLAVFSQVVLVVTLPIGCHCLRHQVDVSYGYNK